MPQPYPSALGGLSRGIRTGMEFDLKRRQLDIEEDQIKEKNLLSKKKQEAVDRKQQISTTMDLLKYAGDEAFASGVRKLKELTGVEFDVERIIERKQDFTKDLSRYQDYIKKYPDEIEGARNLLQGIVTTYGSLPSFESRTKGIEFDKKPLNKFETTGIAAGISPGDVQAGVATQEEAKKVLDLSSSTSGGGLPADIRIFETVYGNKLGKGKIEQGSEEYRKLYTKYRENLIGRKQVLGADDTGNLITFNPLGGKIETTVVPQPQTVRKGRISGEQVTAIATIDTLLDGIKDIRKLAGVRPDTIGPIEGTWTKLKIKFEGDKDATTLLREVESLITLAYGLSGKQISVEEMKMLKAAILPTVTMPNVNFLSALDHAEKWLGRNRFNRLNILDQAGYHIGNLGRKKEDTKVEETDKIDRPVSEMSDEELERIIRGGK